MDILLNKSVLIPALPLAGAIVTAILGPRMMRNQSHMPIVAAIVLSFLVSLGLIGDVLGGHEKLEASLTTSQVGFETTLTLWNWADIGNALKLSGASDSGWKNFRIDVTLRADALTAIMLGMVTFVSSLVAIFAVGYMQGDRSYWRFFSYIGLFVFSMTMLVSVSNFVLLYVFWEAVGVCSYLLIGFWYQKPEAAAAGKKAFLVNRVGDFGFALALFLIWTTYGTLNFHDSLTDGTTEPTAVAEAKPATADAPQLVRGVLGQSRLKANDYVGGGIGLAICLLLLLGACGKSAQFPLHVWLPDAMEGPTPVSALIHAATMVTAGVYMVARCTPLYMASPDAQLIVSVVGGFTALMAGLIALTQFDLKRVLAYSTVSQLGFMFLALGTGTLAGITAGMFHLFTHAFFKALLFLGSGSVMHAMGHVIDMRRFSGLRRRMPITHGTFLFGCLALAGVAPFAGFWSKDGIVAAVHEKAHELSHAAHGVHGHISDGDDHAASTADSPLSRLSASQLKRGAVVYEVLFYSAMFTAFLTAFYTFRAFFMTFYGEEKIPREAGSHAHESPSPMTVPLAILAACALFVGMYFELTHEFWNFLRHTPSLAFDFVRHTEMPAEEFSKHAFIAGVSTVVAFAGIGLALYLYLGDRREVEWLTCFMSFDWLTRLSDVEFVSRAKNNRWIALIHGLAGRLYLGWLTALIGYVLLVVVLILSIPVLIGYFVSPYRLSYGKFFWDELYDWFLIRPIKAVANLAYAVDRWLVDGLVNFCGRLPKVAGSLMRSLQIGLVQFYALAMVLGLIVILVAKLVL